MFECRHFSFEPVTQGSFEPSEPERPTTLELREGVCNVVLGRNRAGKTDLCRLLAGLPAAATGEVYLQSHESQIGGESDAGTAPAVALVNQAFVNYPHWTVLENIASPLRAQGIPPAQWRRKAEDLAERLGLADLLARLPAQLSGGQQQRVAIGRALAKGAPLLVMDEPFVNLDYKLREELRLELAQLVADSVSTLVYTTSDPADALQLADWLVLLDARRVLQVGAPLDLFTAPNSRQAADLLSDPGVNALDDTSVVRPEQVQLEATVDAHRSLQGRVTGVETNGSATYVHLDLEPQNLPWVVKLSGLHRIAPQTRLRLFVAEEDVLHVG